jgi:ribosomal small subunit protein bTHX
LLAVVDNLTNKILYNKFIRLNIKFPGENHMGKGDIRTAKGKRFAGSFGNVRPKLKNKKRTTTTPKKGK